MTCTVAVWCKLVLDRRVVQDHFYISVRSSSRVILSKICELLVKQREKRKKVMEMREKLKYYSH